MWKYCGRISKLSFLFLYIIFPFFLSIIHTFLLFFLLIFLHHTRIPIYPYPLPFFFLYFPLSRTSLYLSFSNSLSQLFFFIFYLIPTHYLALSVIRNGEKGRERKNRWVRWLCSAAAARLPPHRRLSSSPPPGWVRSASFFFFFFFFFSFSFFFHICLFWFNFILRIGFCFVFCVWIMWETERMREKKNPKEREITDIIVAEIVF